MHLPDNFILHPYWPWRSNCSPLICQTGSSLSSFTLFIQLLGDSHKNLLFELLLIWPWFFIHHTNSCFWPCKHINPWFIVQKSCDELSLYDVRIDICVFYTYIFVDKFQNNAHLYLDFILFMAIKKLKQEDKTWI